MTKPEFPTVHESALQGVVRTNLDHPMPTAAQRTRKETNTAAVAALGLPTLAHLPVVEDEAAVPPRTATEVGQRAIATVICAVKGETNDQPFVEELLARFAATSFLSPAEHTFAFDANATQQDLVNFAWRYECVHVFLWALGYLDALNPPHQIANVGPEAGIFRDQGANFVANAKPRPMVELLDAADRYYRLHWAAIELRLRGESHPAVHEGIVMERHRALNWLIRYQGQNWGDVQTDT